MLNDQKLQPFSAANIDLSSLENVLGNYRMERREKELRRWQSTEPFSYYETGRSIFREASAITTRDVLKNHVDKEGRILEIGCGIGELIRQVPSYSDRLLQTDASTEAVSFLKSRNPQANVQLANVYGLPFESETFKTVVGFASFDVFGELNLAVSESARVLKPGGKFIHLLDLQPSIHPIYEKLLTPDRMVFPFVEKVDGFLALTGFQVVRRDEYEREKETFNPKLIPAYDLYTADPEDTFVFCSGVDQREKFLVHMAQHISQLNIERTVVRMFDFFRDRIEEACGNSGLTVLENRKYAASVEKSSSDINIPLQNGENQIVNNLGVLTYHKNNDLTLKRGMVQVVSHLHVVVAEKGIPTS